MTRGAARRRRAAAVVEGPRRAQVASAHHAHVVLGVGLDRNPSEQRGSADRVRASFEKYDLLDEQVRFLEGYFRDTLADAPVEKLAVLRLDGDMYESAMDTLVPLYPKLSPGGYVIIDDYARANCRQAVTDYRERHGILDEIQPIDWTGRFWQKSG